MAKAKNSKNVFRLDGWKNILTGLGIKGKDKREASFIEWSQMSESDADSLYSASDIAGKIVDELITEAFREGYELTADDMPDALIPALVDEAARLKVDEKIQEAWRYARIYGGGGIILIPNDLTKLNTPFVPEQVAQVKSLLVLTRWELVPGLPESDIRSPNFGRPASYRICPRTGTAATQETVHHSRVLRFDGAFLPKTVLVKNNYWHDSVLNKCLKPIRDYDAALSAVSATLDDFSVAVIKVKDLTRSIAEDRDDLIVKRLEIMNMSRSVAKAIILDADKEEYQYQNRTLTGIAEAVGLISARLVVASNMPHTKILGESPEGSQATGNSTTKDWYDHVRSSQENYLDEKLITLWKWILSAKSSPTKGKIPNGFKAIYAPLWQESEGERAKTRYAQAQTDEIYITQAVLDPAEVAVSRFGSGEYSTETKLMEKKKLGELDKPESAPETKDKFPPKEKPVKKDEPTAKK